MAEDLELDDKDSLRDTIGAAVKEVTAPETPVEVEATEKPVETKLEKPKEEPKTGKTVEKAAEATKPKESKQTELKVEQPQKAKPGEAPQNWPAKDRELFAKQPKEVQEQWLRRDKEMEAGFTKKMQEVSALQRDAAVTAEYNPVHQRFLPYMGMLQQRGLTPAKIIDGWMNVEQRFMNGDGLNAIKDIAKAYNIDLSQISQAPVTQDGKTIQLPPEIQRQLGDLTDFKRSFEQKELQRQADEQRNQLSSKTQEIDTFAEMKDEKGNLVHPYFEDVKQKMTELAWGARMAGQPVPALEDLYQTAVHANPETRAKVIAAMQEAAQTQAREAARAQAAKAKAKGVSVTGSPGAGQARPSQRGNGAASLRDDLRAALEAYEPPAA